MIPEYTFKPKASARQKDPSLPSSAILPRECFFPGGIKWTTGRGGVRTSKRRKAQVHAEGEMLQYK